MARNIISISDDQIINKDSDLFFSMKDLYHIKNVKTTAGSSLLKNYISTISCDIFNILIKKYSWKYKVNLDEFGVGSDTKSYFGQTKITNNQLGGSSGACALQVERKDVHFSIGTDTGGSIRDVVFALDGVIGFKPSYGAWSRYGLIPHCNPLDCVSINILLNNLSLLKEIFLQLIKGHSKDSTKENFTKFLDAHEYVFKTKILFLGKKPENDLIINHLLENCEIVFEERGVFNPWIIEGIYKGFSSTYLFSNMSKYFIYDFSDKDKKNQFKNIYQKNNAEIYEKIDPRIIDRMKAGKWILEKGRFHIYQKMREKLIKQINSYFKTYDIIITYNRDPKHSFRGLRGWGLILSNLCECPSIAIKNLNFISKKYSDLFLIDFFDKNIKK